MLRRNRRVDRGADPGFAGGRRYNRSGGAIRTAVRRGRADDARSETVADRAPTIADRRRPLARSAWIWRYWLARCCCSSARPSCRWSCTTSIYPAPTRGTATSPTYLWQVQGLRDGQICSPPTGGMPAVLPALADRRHGTGSSSRSTRSGWPGVMLVGRRGVRLAGGGDRVRHRARGARHVRVHPRDHPRPHAGARRRAALMLASPMLITQSGVYLGYLFTLGLGLLFGAALLAGLRSPRPGGCLVAAGVLLGVALHHPTVRRRAVGRRVGWVRDLHHLAASGSASSAPSALRAASGSCRSWSLTLVYNQHRHRARSPSSRSPPRTRSTPSASGTDASCRTSSACDYTARSGGAGHRAERVLPPAVPRRELPGGCWSPPFGLWFRRRDRTHAGCSSAMMLVFPARLLLLLGQPARQRRSPTSPGPSTSSRCSCRCASSSPPRSSRSWRQRPLARLIALVCVLVGRDDAVPLRQVGDEPPTSARRRCRGSDGADAAARQVAGDRPRLGSVPAAPQPVLARTRPTSTVRVLYAVDQGAENFDVIDAHPDRTPYMRDAPATPRLDDAIHHSDASPPTVTIAADADRQRAPRSRSRCR